MGKYFLRRSGGFISLLIGTVYGMVGLIGADTILQFFGYPNWMVSMRQFLQNPPLFFFPILLVLAFIGFALAYLWESQSEREKFEQEWNGLQYERKTLLILLEKALVKWWRDGPSIRIKEFARRARFPNDVLTVFGNISDYAERALESWPEEQRRLLEFCADLYPETWTSGLLTAEEDERLDKARSKLSKFWDTWGRKVFDRGKMSPRHISASLMKNDVPYLVLLTYLEVAAARPAGETGEGKQNLFKMAKYFCDKTNFR
jgi:hypothetical protein